MIYVLTGNGKGKTTSAIGMAIRAVGAGKKVLMVQFLKDGRSSEVKIIKKIKNFNIKSFGKAGFGSFSKKDAVLAQKGLNFFEKEAQKGKYNLIILDEMNLALSFGLISVRNLLSIVKGISKNVGLVFTGRRAPKKLIRVADLVTDFREIKHYFKKGIKAKKGSEF